MTSLTPFQDALDEIQLRNFKDQLPRCGGIRSPGGVIWVQDFEAEQARNAYRTSRPRFRFAAVIGLLPFLVVLAQIVARVAS